jgi:hypothetical protein
MVEELSRFEYQRFLHQIKQIYSVSNNDQLFMLCYLNFQDFNNTIQKYVDSIEEKTDSFFNDYPLSANINRLLLNLLSSIRFFLDFSEKQLKHSFGIESGIYRNFENSRKIEFEKYFSYRLLESVRNFAQHAGYPVGSIHCGKETLSASLKKQMVYIDMFFVRSQLLEDECITSNLRGELRDMPELIPVQPNINEYAQSIERIYNKLSKALMQIYKPEAEEVKNTCSRLKENDNLPVVFTVGDDLHNIQSINHTEIPLSLCERIIHNPK